MDLSTLYTRKASESFTAEEIDFIKANQFKKTTVNYGIWRQERRNKKYVIMFVDFENGVNKRPAIFKSVEIITSRNLCEIEKQEFAENFGFQCNNRRFIAWNYEGIEKLIAADQLYNIKTPEKFVQECFNRKLSASYQSTLNL